jgi:hypothetical protein
MTAHRGGVAVLLLTVVVTVSLSGIRPADAAMWRWTMLTKAGTSLVSSTVSTATANTTYVAMNSTILGLAWSLVTPYLNATNTSQCEIMLNKAFHPEVVKALLLERTPTTQTTGEYHARLCFKTTAAAWWIGGALADQRSKQLRPDVAPLLASCSHPCLINDPLWDPPSLGRGSHHCTFQQQPRQRIQLFAQVPSHQPTLRTPCLHHSSDVAMHTITCASLAIQSS